LARDALFSISLVGKREIDTVTTWDVQDLADSVTDREPLAQLVSDEASLREALEAFSQKEPRVVLVGISDTTYLHVGVGGPWAFVEHVVNVPWKAQVALPTHGCGVEKPTSVWFTCAGQGSEIPAKFLMPAAEAIELVVQLYRKGTLPDTVEWELV
jgi:hypothetical protein